MRLRDGKIKKESSETENHVNDALVEDAVLGPSMVVHAEDKPLLNDEAHQDVIHHGRHGRGLDGDLINVCLLSLLYVLQGIPLGLAGSIPMVLQNKKITYKEQAVFSFVFWPFSLKLLWAPIVDSLYSRKFGRRKSWLVPVQYTIGGFMLLFSKYCDDLLETDVPRVGILTVIFFMFNFLAATQDIAVDGWALTMLKPSNVGYASTCNSVGQTAGYFLGNVVFLALNSADFSNSYLRTTPQDTGVVTLSSFMLFWGVIFIITTTLVWIFKREKGSSAEHSEDLGIFGTYKLLLRIIRLPAVMSFAVILLTTKIGFAAADGITGLKLVESGVKRETLALLAIPLVPVQIILPLVISKYTAGPRPLDMYTRAIPMRLIFGIVFALIVYWTKIIHKEGQGFPTYYYVVILIIYLLHQVTLYTMFVSVMAFHAKVSDPVIGGTYMTLLNTVSNLGSNWPVTLALWSVDGLTWKYCNGVVNGDCNSAGAALACKEAGGSCEVGIDGYYIESVICIFLGFLWILWRRKTLTYLQNLKNSAWKVT